MTAVGTTLSTTNGTWSNNPTTFAYAWNRGASRIEGVNDPTYTVAINDVGQMISATVTAINAAGVGAADSNALGPIEPPPPVHVDPEPEILGLPQVGGTLVATNGGWMGTGLTFARQWLRDDVPILNAILQTYAPTDDDLDAMLSVDVTAWTAEGGSASATSDPVGPVIQAVVGGPIFDPSDLGPARPA